MPAVWKLAWPTMLQNIIAGLQGIIDHIMVGHYVGYVGNAAIGVSWQIVLVVIVFISSVFTGMAVLVARFAGAGDSYKVNRVVYQSFLTAAGLSAVLGVVGYAAAPWLLTLINAAPEVRLEALPFLRTMFVGIVGLIMFFMLSGAFRAAGDPRTPLRLGLAMTVLTIALNVTLIPIFGTIGAAFGTVTSSTLVSAYGVWRLTRPDSVIHFEHGMDRKPDWVIIRSLFKFGLPTGVQGIAMNIGGVFLLRFIGSLEHSAAAQAAFAVDYTELFSLITWTSTGLLGASATIAGQIANRPRGRGDRRRGVRARAAIPAGRLRHDRSAGAVDRPPVARLSRGLGIVHHGGAQLHGRPSGYWRHAQPALHFHHFADCDPARAVHVYRSVAPPRARRHLDGDRPRPLHPLRAERRALPAAEMAHDCGRYRTRPPLRT